MVFSTKLVDGRACGSHLWVTVEAPYVEERTYSLLSLHIGVVTVVQYFVCPIYIFLKNFPTQVLMFCACVYFMTMQKWLNQLRCRLAPSGIYDWCVWLCGACICIHVFLVSKEFCEYCAITARSIGLLLIAWQPTNGPVGQLGAQKGPPQSLSVAGCTFLFRATGSSGPHVADILVL